MFNNVIELIQWIESQKRLTPKVSLERFRKICAIYGSPEKRCRFIHVGGTNGKGSTVSFIKSILRKAGFNVGGYVSPYVISFNERIAYNDAYINDSDLLEIGNYLLSKYEEIEDAGLAKPSFFEFVTLIAFTYFSRIPNLDFVVLEVGLGGLLDATNIVTPLVSTIASISYDHMNVLGNTLQEIAFNKLGIVKPQIPLVTLKNEEILDLVVSTCKERGSELILVDKANIRDVEVSISETKFSYLEFPKIRLQLLGFHQCENAALAIETVKVLRKSYSISISDEDIYQGLYQTFWPGRLQVISKNPVILIDGAHNIDGITRLTEFLKAIKDRPLRVVFAVSADKAKADMIPILETVADEMIFSKFNYKRSDKADALLEYSHHPYVRVEEDLDLLLKEAKADFGKITVFCGSLYFVSEIFKKL